MLFRKSLSVLLAILICFPLGISRYHIQAAFADELDSPEGSTSGSTSNPGAGQFSLDPASLRIIEIENAVLTHSGGELGGQLLIATEPIDPTLPVTFAFYANASDGLSTVLFVGGQNSDGETWMNSTRFSMDETEQLQAMMAARGSPPAGTGAGYFDGFWSNYWHYLTNPSEMDDDLEYAFYGAVGTAAVAGTAAGGVAAWGAMGGGQFAVGVSANAGSWIPHVTYGYGSSGVYTWAHGVGAAGFTTTYGAVPGTYTLTGIPILAPGAVATWVGTRPDIGNCACSCLHAFIHGWWPF